jgi:hypothetical protein
MYRSTVFLTLALVGSEWSALCPCRSTPGERASITHWIGGWVGPRTGLDDMEKLKFLILLGLELRHLGRPARSKSLYRQRYSGLCIQVTTVYSSFRSTCCKFGCTSACFKAHNVDITGSYQKQGTST